MFKRGDIWLANLNKEYKVGVQSGVKPVLIVSNDTGNTYSPSVIVVVITSRTKKDIPTHTDIYLRKWSTVMCEQMFTISKEDLITFERKATQEELERVNKCLKISLGVR